MVEKNIYDELGISAPGPNKPIGHSSSIGKTIIIIISGVVLFLVLIGLFLKLSENKGAKSQTTQDNTEINVEATKVKDFGVRFINKFYFYNRDSFINARREVEKMMTPSFLDIYKKIYYDTDFENLVLDSYLIIKVVADRVLYRKNLDNYQVKITGQITYENGKTGASITRAATWLLTIVDNQGELQVKDFDVFI